MRRFASIEEYVKELNGKRVIKKVLIANNGLSALKGIRSMKEWEYETFGKHIIKFVVMATQDDITANAEFIHHGDVVKQVPGGSNENNYANVRLIVKIAEETGCDAVWPGWGHASEFPTLPRELSKRGIQFIGPDCSSMTLLGDKISSSIIAENAGVPTMPWSGSGLVLKEDEKEVSEELYKKACINSEEDAVERAKKVGYPIMIKASEGGGGKGIRKAHNEKELRDGYNQVRKEVQGSPIFLMRLASNNRHLEVQLICDQYNNAVALYSRDCSVQRRHQKIIEEGPVTVAPREIVAKMEKAAIALAKAVNYQNAGTVEYLYDNGKFYFLELNPRLQVEHPVSEWITNVNLPSIQLQVGMGIPLEKIPDIRHFYRKESYGKEKIDLENDPTIEVNGHTIAVRITAENPENGFLGTSGSIEELAFAPTRNVWGYFSVRIPGGIHSYSDSQFGHIFAHGKNREEARRNMVVTLSRLNVRGKVSNTSKYTMGLLEQETFKQNKHTTSWLDSLIAENEKLQKLDHYLVVTCGAIHVCHHTWSTNRGNWIQQLQKGQYPDPEFLNTRIPVDLVYENVKYSMVGYVHGENKIILELNNSFKEIEFKELKDGGLLLSIDGESHVCYGREDNQGLRITVDGRGCVFPEESDPSKLKATVSGKVVKFLVEDGAHVEAGQPFIELEVMKMILQMKAELGGKLKYTTVEGSVINQGDLLANVDLDDKMQVKKLEVSKAPFPKKASNSFEIREHLKGKNPHIAVDEGLHTIRNFMTGYGCPMSMFNDCVDAAFGSFEFFNEGKVILVHQFVDCMAVVRASIPSELKKKFEEILNGFFKEKDEKVMDKLLVAYKDCEKNHFSQPARREEFLEKTKSLLDILETAKRGMKEYAYNQIAPFLEMFLAFERPFDNSKPKDKIMMGLRNKHKENLEYCFENALSHKNLERNTHILKKLLEMYFEMDLFKINEVLISSFASFVNREYREIVALSQQLILKRRLPSFRKTANSIRKVFEKVVNIKEEKEKLKILDLEAVSNPHFGFDVLLSFAVDPNVEYRKMAVECYIRKAYATFDINFHDVNTQSKSGFSYSTFTFSDNSANLNDVNFNQDIIAGGITPFPSHENLDEMVFNKKNQLDTEAPSGFGILGLFYSLDDFFNDKNFNELLKIFESPKNSTDDLNVLTVLINNEKRPETNEDTLIQKLASTIKKYDEILDERDIRRVTVVLKFPEVFPNFFTFRKKLGYDEDPIYRNIEPTLAYHLELRKMSNYHVVPRPIQSTSVHVFFAKPKKQQRGRFAHLGNRYFIRTIVFHNSSEPSDEGEDIESKIEMAERYLAQSLNALEHAMNSTDSEETFNNHIFVNLIPVVKADSDAVRLVIERFQKKYAQRLIDLRVSEVCLRLNVESNLVKGEKGNKDVSFIPIRMIITNKTLYQLSIDTYMETKDANGRWKLTTLWGLNNDLNGKPVQIPYPLMNRLELKRVISQNLYQTTYVYDFPFLFMRSVKQLWNEYVANGYYSRNDIPNDLMKVVELGLNEKKELIELKESKMGYNNIGMVAWKLSLKTPFYPQGRDIIVIANDITFMSGSFGPDEDILFDLASKLSRQLRIPRIYITGNSGARIGLAEEVKKVFKVCWNDNTNISKGFKYLYVTPKDYEGIKNYIKAELIEDEGEKRYQITDIIGKQHGIGVECLQGSGMIAGETSRAYKDVFTLSYVAARTVGIGAYLVRLGQRIIQHMKPPIILTGAQALNKLLGRNVYVSHNQLGGTQIMYPNGVTHLCAQDDLQAMNQIVKWISFIPDRVGSPLPILAPTIDPVDRKVAILPKQNKDEYDPRDFLRGVMHEDKIFEGGFFDKGSWFETLKGWAQSIVVARARLGGIPCGVVCVETQTKNEVIPADPAEKNSQEQVVPKAGQVWFPDSAYKTAQAIQDFNNGEQLPMFIFANWRGFSGGQRDMFKEVLKYGSYIVDALVDYKQPIFIYLPPYAELRGGAWVVVDPKINDDVIEMFCDTRSRGGVLEPSGTIEIKYRKGDVLNTIKRLDPVHKAFSEKIENEKDEGKIIEMKKEQANREKKVFNTFQNIATKFADLHDTPGRMHAKNGIEVVPWEDSRKFFFWRLKRRLHEFDIYGKMREYSGMKHNIQMKGVLEKWVEDEKVWGDDVMAVEWYEKNKDVVEKHLKEMKSSVEEMKLGEILNMDPETVLKALKSFVNKEENQEFKRILMNNLITSFK